MPAGKSDCQSQKPVVQSKHQLKLFSVGLMGATTSHSLGAFR